jgi:hypothetical protein
MDRRVRSHRARASPTKGGLMYLHRSLFRTVDRILNGDKPADPAMQRPTKLELILTLNAGKAIDFANS